MIRVADGQIATLWDINPQENYTEVRLSTSRKDKQTGNYLNTSWTFVRFVGEAHKKIGEFQAGDRIRLKGAGLSREPYVDNAGQKVWPKNVKFVVFNFEKLEPLGDSKPSGMDAGPNVEFSDNDDDMPF